MRQYCIYSGAFLTAALVSGWLFPQVGWPILGVLGPVALLGPILLILGLSTRSRTIEWALVWVDRVALVTIGSAMTMFFGVILVNSWRRGESPGWPRVIAAGLILCGLVMTFVGLFGSKKAVDSISSGL